MKTRPINAKMTVDIKFANGEMKSYQTARFLDLNPQNNSLLFNHESEKIYINLNNVNEIKFTEEKETENADKITVCTQ